jgi:non-heme chloroperoxidase
MRLIAGILGAVLACSASATSIAQDAPNLDHASVCRDPSPHTVQYITVDEDVKLEVLDWGGTGRPLVLLAGLGNTAHVFDDFAPKLTALCHVYGITRRGFGSSSAPDSGYSADQLGDDVLAVMNTLKLEKPILVGHSLAGEELSSIGTRHPERVAGLVYLEAVEPYTYYTSRGDTLIDMLEMQRNSGLWVTPIKLADREKLVEDMLQELPQLEKDLQQWQKDVERNRKTPTPPAPRRPTNADTATFTAFQSWTVRTGGDTVS